MNARAIISGTLILFTEAMNIYHTWIGIVPTPESEKMIASLGISPSVMNFLTVNSVLGAIFILIPKTFVVGNLGNAAAVLLMAYYFWSSGNMQAVLIEIPFFLVPFLMIYLRHPFAK